MSTRLVFLKLGGSLITDKGQPHTPKMQILSRLAHEIEEALSQDRDLRILLGHGSGSFGHVPASRYHTREGVKTGEEWLGFVEVWREAAALNHLVMQALESADLPAMAFAPSAMVLAAGGKVETWNLAPLQCALSQGLLPLINGDVVFDTQLGGTILSTEDLFAHLAQQLGPARLLLAGVEPGVWADFPANTRLLDVITPFTFPQVETALRGSAATDVTGGMADKVRQITDLVRMHPDLQASIFSGEEPGNVRRALLGEELGTQVHA